MAKEQAREERERDEQAAAQASAEAREQLRGSEALDQAVERVDRAAERARSTRWLQPLRATLPKLKSIGRALSPTPRLDVIDRESEIVVRAEVPGISKDRLEAAVTDDTLLIRAAGKDLATEGRYRRHELRERGFERRVSLPCEVQGDRASGSMRDGVLELVLPKSERARRHPIEIR